MSEQSHVPFTDIPEGRSTSDTSRIESLPPEIGVLLIGFGLFGLVFPGPFGTPLIVAGGLSLWPRSFRKIDCWVQRKMPAAHESGQLCLIRFIDDLEKRYPNNSTSQPEPKVKPQTDHLKNHDSV
ncbi:MAG: hypothetical protein RJA81_137 [Planctomycetota bacterium]